MLIVYSSWWWIASRALEDRIDRWIAAQRAQGATITPDRVSIGGFPFAFSVKTTGASLAWPNGFGFAPQLMKLRTHPWSPRTVSVSLTGGYTIKLPPGSARPPMTMAGETLRGSMHFGDGPTPLALSLKSDTVSVSQTGNVGQTGGDGAAAHEMTSANVELNFTRPETPPAADTDVAADATMQLTDLSAASIESNPLGGIVKNARIHIQLLGIPPGTYDAAGLSAWRDAGGTINAPELALRWGSLGLSGSGTLALDKNMQPEGAFTAKITGFAESLDAMAAAGWIKLSVVSIAKIGLGIASRPDEQGTPVVTTPVTIQNRQISLGAFRLGRLPELKLD